MRCGDANKGGNILILFKGGCGMKILEESLVYRCVGCDGAFHKACIINHFKLEKEDDWGRNEEKKEMKKKLKKFINNL